MELVLGKVALVVQGVVEVVLPEVALEDSTLDLDTNLVQSVIGYHIPDCFQNWELGIGSSGYPFQELVLVQELVRLCCLWNLSQVPTVGSYYLSVVVHRRLRRFLSGSYVAALCGY